MVKHVFRAKDKEDGRWYKGSLLDDQFILQENDNTNYYQKSNGEWLIDEYIVEIIPETIGQDTGLKDVDGKHIFEGDILERLVKRLSQPFRNLIVISDVRQCQFNALIVNDCKIIGNIHDNPELLEPKCEVSHE